MRINAHLYHKADDYRTEPCEIEKIVEVSKSKFAALYRNPLRDFDFIAEYNADSRTKEPGVTHCLLVLGEGSDDGILACTEGYDYARYSTHIPNARQIVNMEQTQKNALSAGESLPFDLERANRLLDKALTYADQNFADSGDLYAFLTDTLGMSQDEIENAGFLMDRFYDPDADESTGMKGFSE